MSNIVRILGEGGFAREVKSYLQKHGFLCFMQDSQLADKEDKMLSVIGIGNPYVKEIIDKEFSVAVWKHNGLILCPGAQITVNIEFGRHVHVNLNATIGHDCVIGDYCTIAPGANISGNVTIGKRCYIGTGAAIIEKITICDDVVIGAGAVVIRDITEPGTYVGNPAKKVK